jgi:GntR family transcriptional regulator
MIDELDRNSSKPLYLQIYEALSDLLDSGTLKPGDQFPKELELAERYEVARITVRRAISDMVHEGRLVRLAGKGTFVAKPKIDRYLIDISSFSRRLSEIGLESHASVLESQIIPATSRLSQELEIALKAEVFKLVRLRYSNDDPVAIETSYLSMDRFPGIDQVDFSSHSLYKTLGKQYGVEPRVARRTLELTTANKWEAEQLNTTKSAPLFLLRAQVKGAESPIESVKILLRGDRFRFQISTAHSE